MLAIQPPFIRAFFAPKSKQNEQPKGYRRMFLSWEDGLWHLLKVYKVKRGATVLLPEFYCGDVANHMLEHGLEVTYYPVDRLLVTSTVELVRAINKYKPEIVVIFHAVSITNTLMSEADKWQRKLSPTCLIIEDCVHRIVEQERITFLSERHFLMDSLRKVVPIQGSNTYSKCLVPAIPAWQTILTLPYRLVVLYYWLAMQIWVVLAHFTQTKNIAMRANAKAEQAMINGYLLIGKSRLASPGLKIMDYLYRRLNTREIAKTKDRQARAYVQALQPLLNNSDYWLPSMVSDDYKYLRGLPMIMSLKVAETTLERLRNIGIMVRFELNDGPWSRKQKIIYLPMGIHVGKEQIEEVASLISSLI